MLILLHGDNVEQSRTELMRLRASASGKLIREVSGRSTDSTQLTQALSSPSMFGGDMLVVVERLFSSITKKTTLVTEYAKILAENAEITDIVLWEDKLMSATVIKQLGPNAAVRLFKMPVVLFTLLDTVRPGAAQKLLLLYAQTVQISAPELVYAMLVRRIGQLLTVSSGNTPASVRDWQLKKLKSQARLFTAAQLRTLQDRLLKAEYDVKRGASPFSIADCTELFLADV